MIEIVQTVFLGSFLVFLLILCYRVLKPLIYSNEIKLNYFIKKNLYHEYLLDELGHDIGVDLDNKMKSFTLYDVNLLKSEKEDIILPKFDKKIKELEDKYKIKNKTNIKLNEGE